jgi:hypothetical protein
VIGIPSGGKNAALNVSSAAVAKAMTQLRERSGEIRGHSQLLPSERARRLDELRPAALAAARAHQQTLKAEKARITHMAKTASPVKPLSQMPADAMWTGQLLCQKLMQMSVSEKTQIVAKCMADPAANPLWTQVLLQWPLEVTGVDASMHERLRSAALQAMDPALAESIDAQLQQLELAERADSLAQQVLAETLPGAIQELREAPPEPETPAALTAADYLAAVSEEALADLRSGPGLSRPSRVELSRAQA